MSKGLPKATWVTIQGPFGGHDRPEGKDAAIQAIFVNGPVWTTIKTRPKRRPSVTPLQELQRRDYSDCDCLWKARTPEQAEAWEEYIKDYDLIKKEDLDSYRIFMKQCLKWNLVDYLEQYLYAVWRLISIKATWEGTTITVRMGSLLDDFPPPPWWEPELIFNRII
jgi:hypothetical protein